MTAFSFKDMLALMKAAARCRCPACHRGAVFKGGLSLEFQDACTVCGLDFSAADSADGPAVLMIFLLGGLCAPLAIALDFWLYPPLWVHFLLWTGVGTVLTVLGLPFLKAYVLALQYKYRRHVWEDETDGL